VCREVSYLSETEGNVSGGRTEVWRVEPYTVLLQSIRPSRVPDLGGLDEIGPTSQVTAHLANVGIWFKKYVKIHLIHQKVDTSVHY